MGWLVPRGAEAAADRGQMRELSWRDPRERNLPVVAAIYCGVLLLQMAIGGLYRRPMFWALAALTLPLVAALEWRLRRVVEVWGDESGLILNRFSDSERVLWKDVEAVEGRYSSKYLIRFRRDTRFGRTVRFRLKAPDRWIGFDHPLVLWVRQCIEDAVRAKV